jgi:hypothetical protein
VTLKFAPTTHRYTCDGRSIPGVTSLISGGMPKPALVGWAARTIAEFVADNPDEVEQLRALGRGPMVAALKEIHWRDRDAAANKGSEIHVLAEDLVNGREVEVPEYLAGHVEAAVRFLDEWQPVPLLTEVSVVNRKWWYAGRLDLIADFPDGRRRLIDWKSNRSGIFGETALQLSAYRYAEKYVLDGDPDTEIDMPEVDEAWAVHVRADGYDVIPLKADEQTHKEFLHVKYVADVSKRIRSYVGAALDAPTTTERSA